MGIKNLMKILAEEAPACIKEIDMSALSGRAVAIDASMALYQFLIAVRSNERGAPSQMLMNESGEVTSHLQGMFNRTIRLMDNGIKPVWVFDGKPPTLKGGELAKRSQKRQEAKENLGNAEESGNIEDIDKFTKRLVRVSSQQNEDCKELLKLMGVPVVTAPCEAEATCAELAKKGKVFAAGTEDMDALTFATPTLLRKLTAPASKKLPILQINFQKALEGLDLSYDQFVDFCILCGCDYCDSIRGIGPKKALNAIREHKTLEYFLESIEKNKPKGVVVPEEWLGNEPIYVEARKLFKEADVIDCNEADLQWNPPKEEELLTFLVEKHGFNTDRVKKAIEKLKKAKSSHSQSRLDNFFTVIPSSGGSKRKILDKKATKNPTKKGKK